MALKLKTSRKEVWIDRYEKRDKPFDKKKNPVVARFKVLPLTPTEMNEVFNSCEEQFFYEMPTKRKEMVRDTKTDPVKFTIGKARKIIKDWEGITTENDLGEEIEMPYSEDMVETLYELNPDEINWVITKADELSSVINKEEEDQIKN